MTEVEKLQEHGFQSIDEYPHLLATYPTKRVDFNGEDLMKRYKTGPHPSNPRKKLAKGFVWLGRFDHRYD